MVALRSLLIIVLISFVISFKMEKAVGICESLRTGRAPLAMLLIVPELGAPSSTRAEISWCCNVHCQSHPKARRAPSSQLASPAVLICALGHTLTALIFELGARFHSRADY